jgi:hypothetical protein
MTSIRVLVMILGVGLLAGCSAPVVAPRKDQVSHIEPEPEVLTQAGDVGFDYVGNLRRAEKGELDATVALINFSSHTDAAGSLAHGWVLLDLEKRMGRAKFASILARATKLGRTNALEHMEVARTYK